MGEDSGFVCDLCVRAYLRDLLRATRLTLSAAGLLLASKLQHRLSSNGLERIRSAASYAFFLTAASTILIGMVVHFRWKRKFAIEAQLFEREQRGITRQLDRTPSSLRFYDPEFYARHASAKAAKAINQLSSSSRA